MIMEPWERIFLMTSSPRWNYTQLIDKSSGHNTKAAT
jgi:hypothetical protein